jgi:hypothetical protein
MTLSPLLTKLSAKQRGKVNVARVVPPAGLEGSPRFRVNGIEMPPADVVGNALAVEPAYWGEGTHSVEAEWIQGDKVVQRSDNAVPLSIGP